MSKIYLKQLQELTISHHNNKLARIYLTTDDEQILRNALQGEEKRRFSQWGALAPRDLIARWANASIISWTLECAGMYCRVNEIGSCLQLNCAYVDSHVMEEELKRFESKDGYRPLTTMMKINLSALRTRLNLCNAPTLREVPNLDYTAFILNSRQDSHWSLLIYSIAENTIAHFDSMGDVNENLAERAYKMLVALRLIPAGTRIRRLANPTLQRGSWECGFSVIATALSFSDTLKYLVPDRDAQSIAGNSQLLCAMISQLLKRSEAARALDQFYTLRLERIYDDK